MVKKIFVNNFSFQNQISIPFCWKYHRRWHRKRCNSSIGAGLYQRRSYISCWTMWPIRSSPSKRFTLFQGQSDALGPDFQLAGPKIVWTVSRHLLKKKRGKDSDFGELLSEVRSQLKRNGFQEFPSILESCYHFDVDKWANRNHKI